MKTWKLTFPIDFIDLKTLDNCYMKTTYLIDLKLTGPIEQVNNGPYTNFQSILNFNKNLYNFEFKVYRGLLWSCKYPYKLK